MNLLFFIIGAVTAGVASFIYFNKQNNSIKTSLEKYKRMLFEEQNKSSLRVNDLERELDSKIDSLKKTTKKNELIKEKTEALNHKILNLEKVNQSLKKENDKYHATIREYEMLFSAKKDEITKLKNQLKK